MIDWEAIEKEAIRIRRDLHTYPESGWLEFRTTSVAASMLESLGYEVRTGLEVIEPKSVMGRAPQDVIERNIARAVEQGADPKWIERMDGYTGALGILDTGRPGPTVAFRFDIDCVDVAETQDPDHRPRKEGFASVNPGWMHACGHDAHTAMGLMLARVLMEEKDELCGKVLIIFQPAEEGVRGAPAMVDRGILLDVDALVAIHIGGGIPSGTVTTGCHGFLCTTKFDVTYTGVSTHAAGSPQEGRNALLAAATAALNLHAIAPHSEGRTRINVGVLTAGTGRNVIPGKAFMKAETRGDNDEVASYMYERAMAVVRGSAETYGVRSEVEKTGEAISADSNFVLREIIRDALDGVPGISNLQMDGDALGSDDATWMMRAVQDRGGVATYMRLGSNTGVGHHNDHFDVDEATLVTGIRSLEAVVRRGARFLDRKG